MKKSIFCITCTAVLMVSSVLWSSCNNDDDSIMNEEELIEYLKSDKCPKRTQAFQDSPQWLSEKVAQMEDAAPWRLFTHVYTFSYEGNVYYLIYTAASATMFDHIYNAHGTEVTFPNSNWYEKAKDWVCIYVQE